MRTWTGTVYLATTGVGTPDRPVCSQSPYRLSFRCRHLDKYIYLICYCEDCYKDNSSKVHFIVKYIYSSNTSVDVLDEYMYFTIIMEHIGTSKVKKSTFSLSTHREGIRESGVIAPYTYTVSSRWSWMVSFTPLPVYPVERRHCVHRVGGWMGDRGGQDVLGKRASEL